MKGRRGLIAIALLVVASCGPVAQSPAISPRATVSAGPTASVQTPPPTVPPASPTARQATPVPTNLPPPNANWFRVSPMSRQRAYFTATLLSNGKILVAGGVNDVTVAGYATNAVETYDPATQKFNGSTFGGGSAYGPAAPMSVGRAGHTATLLPSGKVLVVGGYTQLGSRSLNTAEVYDPASDSWSMAAPMHQPRSLHAAVLIAGGKVLVMGGSDYPPVGISPGGSRPATIPPEVYDPTADAWTVASMPRLDRPVDPTATVLMDGRVLVVGGQYMWQSPDEATERSELYDPRANTWLDVTPDPRFAARQFHAAVLLYDGLVLVAGGSTDLQATNTAALYGPAGNSWIELPNMFQASCGDQAVAWPSGVVVVAGWGCWRTVESDTDEYDVTGRRWYFLGGYFTGARAAFVALPDGTALEMGGIQASPLTSNLTSTASSEVALFRFEQGPL